ncbi:efflux RND transporter periplasmic adaptor subunit [Photobacterium leiognathi]|uniref:efflux RND transporter periplasmic adaptor subunit n=1 Tax=Photobacterium leiognathi TaxID=553611 RepID=UPI00273305B3|nr:efflux RND transporter periplasmic adaptor subunit [Photobacterium leiognathi]
MKTHSTFAIAALALVIGGVIGGIAAPYFSSHSEHQNQATTPSNDEPLYWVAPMDPNYQRDKPGKSPMGMDLIPIYADDLNGNNDKPGTVKIDPAVENNLGVKTALVTKQVLSPQIATIGYIAFDESQLWQTNLRVSGWVKKLYINAVGEKVKKGDVLFTLYSPELVKAQEELLNAYRSGRSGLVSGAKQRLLSMGVDQVQINQIIQTKKAKQTIDIKALGNGIIASLNVREGGYLSPSQTAISAGTINEVWVNAEIFERQAHWVKQDTPATMTLEAIPNQQWQGKVDYIYPILDPKTRTLRVRLKFANDNGDLKPNMFANITLQPHSEDTVLTIPSQAIIRSGGMSRVVLSEGDGKYRSAKIIVGREANNITEVVKGLKENDRIVTSAQFMLDSESSQSADLSRINGQDEKQASVWVTGTITDIMLDHNMLTINHQPVPEWSWPGMVMNFDLTKNIDTSTLAKNQNIEFEIQKTPQGKYEILALKVSDKQAAKAHWITGKITMLMADFNMITVSHDAVDDWQWSAGEMNFTTDGSIDLNAFKEGESVSFLLEKENADYVLKALKPATNKGDK